MSSGFRQSKSNLTGRRVFLSLAILCGASSAFGQRVIPVGGSMPGVTIRTAASGARIEQDSVNGLRVFDSGGSLTFRITPGGFLEAFGSAIFSGCGMQLINDSWLHSDRYVQSVEGFYIGAVSEYPGTQVVGPRGATISDPSGGGVQDAEARTAINTIIDRLQAHGLIS
jgi:hypothetical protein